MQTFPLRELARDHAGSPQKLHQIWKCGSQPWTPDFVLSEEGGQELDEPYTVLARAALQFGETFLALDIAKAGISALERLPHQRNAAVHEAIFWLKHVKALSLARLGSVAEAHELLKQLAKEDESPEILAAMARTFKDLSFLSADQSSKTDCLAKSHEIYLKSYRNDPIAFTGINAAATALWLGNPELAKSLAGEVREICEADLRSDPGNVWSAASLAESLLLEGSLEAAARQYRTAREEMAKGHRWGDISTMRNQAMLHCDRLRIDRTPLAGALRLTLVTFSGHMIDRPGRTHPRFPPSAEDDVRRRIREELDRLEPAFGYSSAACGSDILFLEEMQRRGADTVVVLPWRKEDFLESSVRIVPGGDWEMRFHEVLNNASSVVYLSQQTEPPRAEIGYQYLIDCVNGMTILHADSLHSEVVPLTVWDGVSGGGPGGTHDFVKFWRKLSREPIVIRPLAVEPETGSTDLPAISSAPQANCTESPLEGHPCIKTMLFADVVGYSSLLERLVMAFVTHFLGALSRLISEDEDRPVYVNTWGDAVFFIFDTAPQGGRFALKMLKKTAAIPWKQLGFPSELKIRIGLHTGLIVQCIDPITNQLNYFGAHVCHAARIEPVARPDEVLATEAFAAYARFSDGWEKGETGFSLRYLGLVDFHKKYGMHPLFRLIDASTAATERLPD
jgi:class 3 adenylate cyclase